MTKSLRSFLEEVRQKAPDNLVTIKKEVDPKFELTGVLRKMQEKGMYPITLFENVKGTDIPVVVNIQANRESIALALETTSDRLTIEYGNRQDNLIDPVLVDEADAPVKQMKMIGDEVDLSKFPNITHCELDGGPYISSGLSIMKDPKTGVSNMGIYRHQIKSPTKLGIDIGEYAHGAQIARAAEAENRVQECAIVIGHHPLLVLASQYRGPMEISELQVAGGLLGEPLRLVKCETIDLEVPADAEIVIEGEILPGVREHEGPFGEYTWYMGGSGPSRVFNIKAITYRKDAIYQDLFSAHPEHNLTGLVGREAMIFKKVKASIPTLKAISLPFSGTCRHTVYVSIKKEFDGLGRNAALAALAADPFMKLCIVVDEDIDIHNESEVMWAVATRTQPARDVIIIPEAYVCELDPSAYSIEGRHTRGYMNDKWIIDATKPFGLPFQERAEVPDEVWRNINLDDYF